MTTYNRTRSYRLRPTALERELYEALRAMLGDVYGGGSDGSSLETAEAVMEKYERIYQVKKER